MFFPLLLYFLNYSNTREGGLNLSWKRRTPVLTDRPTAFDIIMCFAWMNIYTYMYMIDWIGLQAGFYRGFSITCNDSRVHGRGSHGGVPAATKRDSWAWPFHQCDRRCVSYAFCLQPNTWGWLSCPFPPISQPHKINQTALFCFFFFWSDIIKTPQSITINTSKLPFLYV